MEAQKTILEWVDWFIRDVFPNITKEESDSIAAVLGWNDERRAAFFMAKRFFEEEDEMDKQIRKVEKETKKVEKDLKHLEKEDKKRDKLVEAGREAKKKK